MICDRIKIVRSIFRKISTFVNLRSRVSQLFRKSFISLSRICSRCSMRNLKKRTCFKVKRTFLFENFFQNNRELQSISSLQSIKNRRLIKIWKTQNRKVWINTCLRNRFASFSIKIFLRNRSIYYINCQVFSVIWSFQSLVLLQKFLFSFSYFFVFSQSFSLFSRSFRSCQLQKWVALTFTNKSFRSLIVSFNKSNRFVVLKRSWKKTKSKMSSITSKTRIFDSLHSKSRIKSWRNQWIIIRLFHLLHLRYRLCMMNVSIYFFFYFFHFEALFRCLISMISISNISHKIAVVTQAQISLFLFKVW